MNLVAALLLLLASTVSGQECAADGTCDKHERCPVWKEDGECFRNKDYMSKYCPVSCSEKLESQQKECADIHPRCPVWAELGECEGNVEMEKYCAKSCDSCHLASEEDELCKDEHQNCRFWADTGECDNNPRYMHASCAKSCGTCPETTKKIQLKELDLQADKEAVLAASEKYGMKQTADGKEALDTLRIVREASQYMASEEVATLPSAIRENCQNRKELCSFWASIGECEANQAFMKINCAPACKSCHLIDFSTRCPPRGEDAVPGLRPGDLNKMFERIVATAPGNQTSDNEENAVLLEDGMINYTVNVLSRPSELPATDIDLVNDKSLPPWVITFENFISPEECEVMIELGREEGYKRSEDVGEEKFDGTVEGQQSEGRTSENAWCSTRGGCREKEVPKRIHDRIAKVLGVPSENSEDFQMLRYEVGQFYKTHHDYIPHQKDRSCGPRILTFFIYASDVDAGGGTDFPDLGITVMPKQGRALLWPSVYDSNPEASDPRMRHQALPVEAGTKFAANGWIHLYDYVGPQARGCN